MEGDVIPSKPVLQSPIERSRHTVPLGDEGSLWKSCGSRGVSHIEDVLFFCFHGWIGVWRTVDPLPKADHPFGDTIADDHASALLYVKQVLHNPTHFIRKTLAHKDRLGPRIVDHVLDFRFNESTVDGNPSDPHAGASYGCVQKLVPIGAQDGNPFSPFEAQRQKHVRYPVYPGIELTVGDLQVLEDQGRLFRILLRTDPKPFSN